MFVGVMEFYVEEDKRWDKKKAEGTKKKMNRMLKMRMKIRMIDGD